jgi:hypothetical protein
MRRSAYDSAPNTPEKQLANHTMRVTGLKSSTPINLCRKRRKLSQPKLPVAVRRRQADHLPK